ncbi:MAG: creatininase family protein [Microbacteriaceae bacterium]|nr:MAG: creatininase family protein [Microbacteriaceae bacterium]
MPGPSLVPPRVRWAEHRHPELAGLVPAATVVIPIGATEQHGDHLPVGTDHIVIDELATRAARRATTREEPVLVAPTIPYGASHHHLPHAGTMSLSAETALRVLTELMSSLAVTGCQRIVILNGHGGNDDIIRQAVRNVCLEHTVLAAAASYWTVGGEALRAHSRDDYPVPGHAGAFETSLLLALHPELVSATPRAGIRVSLPSPAGTYVESHRWVDRMGLVSDPAASADADAGASCIEVLTDALAEVLREIALASP